MKTLGILVIVVLIWLYEVPKMRRQKMNKEFMVFVCILLLATTIIMLEVNGITVPNPLEGINRVFAPIGKGIESFFAEKGK